MEIPQNSTPPEIENPVDGDEEQEKFDTQKWLSRIKKARLKEQQWRIRAKKCINIYRDSTPNETTNADGRVDSDACSFNILFSNTETILPALISSVPKPDVRTRYLTGDKTSEAVAQIIERTLICSLDEYKFIDKMVATVKDYILTGRGVGRVRLIPKFETRNSQNLVIDGVDEVGNPITRIEETEEEVLVGQKVSYEVVDWDSVTFDPVKSWEDMEWMSFTHDLSEEKFEEYFPGKPLTDTTKTTDRYSDSPTYLVHEIWDKNTKKVYFIGTGDEPFKVQDDPYKYSGFWPIPEPLISIKTNDTMVPVPEYTIYQAQAFELNEVSYRITDLIKSCKLVGVYDSQQPGLNDLLNARDSQFVPVSANLLREGGIKSVIDTLDPSRVSQVLSQLYVQRDRIKEVIYEVTGISDIIRGESKASETATAQNIKAKYAGLRLRNRRAEIDRYIVEVMRMQAELISSFYPIDQLEEISGVKVTPEIQSILKSDILRSYKVDIESDSTIMADMDDEARKRAALVSSITQFISTAAPMVAQGFLPAETAKALLMYAVRATKVSRELEDALELIGQPVPPPSPAGPMGMPPQGMMGQMPPADNMPVQPTNNQMGI